MPTPLACSVIPAIVVFIAIAAPARADRAELPASADNTIFLSGPTSNGGSTNFYVGRSNANDTKRALVAFDVADALPANAVIDRATLKLCLAGASDSESQSRNVAVHRLLHDWGEGTANAGGGGGSGRGAPAGPGDATWTQHHYGAGAWAFPGGDFVATSSADRLVGLIAGSGSPLECEPYTWGSTSDMVADVQGWLMHPENNAGWLFRGDESTGGTQRRFYSRESGDPLKRPNLTLEYHLADSGDANLDGRVDVADLSLLAHHYGQTSGALWTQGDFTGDGAVALDDLLLIQNRFASVSTAGAIATPEPSTGALATIAALAIGAMATLRNRTTRARAER